MIRTVEHKSRTYILIDTSFHVELEGSTLISPIHIRIDITKLSEKDRTVAYGRANRLLNHAITSRNKKPVKVTKPWWKKIF